jgi:hypothetical protein
VSRKCPEQGIVGSYPGNGYCIIVSNFVSENKLEVTYDVLQRGDPPGTREREA